MMKQQKVTWDPLDLGVRVKKLLTNATKPTEPQSDMALPEHQAIVRKMKTNKSGRVVDMSLRLMMPDMNGVFDEESSDDDSDIDTRPRKQPRSSSPLRSTRDDNTAMERAKQELRKQEEREQEMNWNRYAENFGLKSSDRLRGFQSQRDHFTLLTIKPKNNKYPIVARNNANGKTYKFSSVYIQNLLSSEKP
jgi:hypothetical protein